VCHRVLNAIESGVRRGTGVALAMAGVSVEADLTGVSGFPAGEELHHHEDLVVRYGPAREAVAPMSLLRRCWRGSPSLGFFLFSCFALLVAHRRLLLCNGPFVMRINRCLVLSLLFTFLG
jgi:hypothetical protein